MRLVPVARFPHALQADLAVTVLEDAGIPCVVQGRERTALTPLFNPAEGGVAVLVPEAAAEEARALLDGLDAEPDDALGCV